MKRHAIAHLTESATQHVALAKAFKVLSGHFAEMAECMKAEKSGETNPATFYANVSGECHKASDAHASLAESCLEASKALNESRKAMGNDLDALEPTEISAVIPDNPRFRAVPRGGQPQISTNGADSVFDKIYGGASGTDE